MDFDIVDAFLLDSEFALLDTGFSTAAAVGWDSPGPEAQAPAAFSLPAEADRQSPAATDRPPPPPLARRSDSCVSGSDASSLKASSNPKVHYLPPCRVCSGSASGLHYGINTCDACKAFFCRSIHRNTPYKCSKDGKCDVSPPSKSTCSACRYQHCLAVGMTKDAVKTGRYSHAKRTQDTLEVKRLHGEQNESSHGSNCLADLPLVNQEEGCDGTDCIMDASTRALIECLTSAFERSFEGTSVLFKEPEKIEALIRDTLLKYGTESVGIMMFGDPEDSKRMLEMRDEASHTLQPPMSNFDGSSCEGTTSGLGSALMLKFHVEELEMVVRSIVSFAKCIPGYTSLKLHDQITLIKASCSEVIHLIKYKHLNQKLSCMVDYNCTKDVVILVPLSVWHCVWQDEEFYRQCTGNARRLQQLDLSLSDVALLAAIVLASPDREQVLEPERVQAIQEALVAALRCSIAARHGHGNLPAANRLFASLLLHLPMLRMYNQQSQLLAQSLQHRYPFEVPTLVEECLAVRQPDR